MPSSDKMTFLMSHSAKGRCTDLSAGQRAARCIGPTLDNWCHRRLWPSYGLG